MKTLRLKTIIQRYRDVIKNSAAIEAWCLETYGKLPTIYVGFDKRTPPPQSECPSIVIFPGEKMEGDGAESFAYHPSVAWSVVNEAVTQIDNVKEYPGLYESDDFGHLILSELAGASEIAFITEVGYSIDECNHIPQFPGRADITIEIVQTLGGSDEINF